MTEMEKSTPDHSPLRKGGGAVRVGILGAGQLGRMLGLAAVRMGVQVRFLDRAQSGATEGIGETMIGDWSDPELLTRFVDGCDVITTENEWAPAGAVDSAQRGREASPACAGGAPSGCGVGREFRCCARRWARRHSSR